MALEITDYDECMKQGISINPLPPVHSPVPAMPMVPTTQKSKCLVETSNSNIHDGIKTIRSLVNTLSIQLKITSRDIDSTISKRSDISKQQEILELQEEVQGFLSDFKKLVEICTDQSESLTADLESLFGKSDARSVDKALMIQIESGIEIERKRRARLSIGQKLYSSFVEKKYSDYYPSFLEEKYSLLEEKLRKNAKLL